MISKRSWVVVVAYWASCVSADKTSGTVNEAQKKEVAMNIIHLEKSNCNFRLSEMECFNLKVESKWKYIDAFLVDYKCKWDTKMDMQVPGLDASTYEVKCPGGVRGKRPARVYPLLTDSYLSKKGIVFRQGDVIVVPGEGTMPVSQDWDNGTADQRKDRVEIGDNICDWEKKMLSRPSHFCVHRMMKCRCMLELAKVFYLTTYSPTGQFGDYCTPGQMVDLHLPSKCKVWCPTPDHTVQYAEYAFTKDNMYRIPWICNRKTSWYKHLVNQLLS